MKILLYDTGDIRGELNEPTGIELLNANLKCILTDNVQTDLLWYNRDGDDVDISAYDIIGVSVNIGGLSKFDKIYNLAKGSPKKPLIVVGNNISTFGYPQLLSKYQDIICVIGEGEISFTALVAGTLNNHLDLLAIPNLAFMNNGNLVTTKREICDMTNYVPPVRMFDDFLYDHNGIVRVEASRGCSWNRCSFCGVAHKYDLEKWRPISVRVIIDQLISLSHRGFMNVYFSDEDFIGNDIGRFRELVRQIASKKATGEILNDMRYFISTKPVDIVNDEIFEIIKDFSQVGLQDLFIGIESGCREQLKRYNKCSSVSINRNVLDRIQRLNISIDIGFIFFDYEMSVADIEENLNFIEKNNLTRYISSLLKPLRLQPFTKIYQNTVSNNSSDVKGFSLDMLTYEYKFKNAAVQKIYDCFESLGLEAKARVVQSEYRRTLAFKDSREAVSKKLACIRLTQFKALRIITEHFIVCSSCDYESLLSELESLIACCEQFQLE